MTKKIQPTKPNQEEKTVYSEAANLLDRIQDCLMRAEDLDEKGDPVAASKWWNKATIFSGAIDMMAQRGARALWLSRPNGGMGHHGHQRRDWGEF